MSPELSARSPPPNPHPHPHAHATKAVTQNKPEPEPAPYPYAGAVLRADASVLSNLSGFDFAPERCGYWCLVYVVLGMLLGEAWNTQGSAAQNVAVRHGPRAAPAPLEPPCRPLREASGGPLLRGPLLSFEACVHVPVAPPQATMLMLFGAFMFTVLFGEPVGSNPDPHRNPHPNPHPNLSH